MTKFRLITILLVQTFLCTHLFATDVGKMYRAAMTEDGPLYFILPQKMPRSSGSKAKKDLEFDVTSHSKGDSLAVTSTLFSANPFTESTATITVPGDETLRPSVEVIYNDVKKKGYTNRIRFTLPREQFKKLFSASESFVLDFGQGNTFSYSRSKWAKERDLMNQILTMIEINAKQ